MCRIFSYQGRSLATPILMEGLKRLEYGGYDSAGVALLTKEGLQVRKTKGKVETLAELLKSDPIEGMTGIAHTRWATNGAPNTLNAHPHLSSKGRVALVHNGIIESENEEKLRSMLKAAGFTFKSETDTEVLSNLIEWELDQGAKSLEEAVAHALEKVEGAYAIAAISSDYPDQVVGARKSSPLTLGINGGAVFLASDPIALAGYASHTIDLEDGDIVTLSRGQYTFRGQNAKKSGEREKKFDMRPEDVSKGGYSDFMLKEIFEQPNSLRTVLAGRLKSDGTVRLGGIERLERRIADARRIVLLACGTSFHAAMEGKLLIERIAGIPTEVQYAHEFRDPILGPQDVVIAISQSGETMDTLMAVRLAKEYGALCLGINNRVSSTLAREVEAGIYLRAGPEISVASTKAFTAQVAVLLLFALRMAHVRGHGDQSHLAQLTKALAKLPSCIDEALKCDKQMEALAAQYCEARSVLFLGRDYTVPLALEGALKLKEIAYLNAEGHPAGELKHGYIALIEEGVPVIVVVSNDELKGKMIASMKEVQSRGGHIIALRSGRIELPQDIAKHIVELPDVPAELMAAVGAVPLQLFAHHAGVKLGYDVDKPRNLAKSVTVE